MLPASEFFGNSLEELRAYFKVAARRKPKSEIECERLDGGCMLLTPKAWQKAPHGT